MMVFPQVSRTLVIVAIADDVKFIGPEETAREAYMYFDSILDIDTSGDDGCELTNATGLRLNAEKLKVYSKCAETLADPDVRKAWTALEGNRPDGNFCLIPADKGFVFAGCPFGSDAFVEQYCVDFVEEHACKKVTSIGAMSRVQDRLLLLRACVNSTVTHLARVVPRRLFTKAGELFDDVIHAAWQQATGLSVDKNGPEWLIVTLPFREGGHGITPIMRVADAAYLGSQLQILQHDVLSYRPELEPIYAHLDADGGPSDPIRTDFRSAWDRIRNSLGPIEFAKAMGARLTINEEDEDDDFDPTPWQDPVCIYPTKGPLAKVDGMDSAKCRQKWQSAFAKPLHTVDHDALIADRDVRNSLKAQLQSGKLIGASTFHTTVPQNATFEAKNDPFIFGLVERLDIGEQCARLSLPEAPHGQPAYTCPLVAAASGKICGGTLDLRHNVQCNTQLNGKVVQHDAGLMQFWRPTLMGDIGLPSTECEPQGTVDLLGSDGAGSRRKPFDARWSQHPSSYLQGFDLTYGHPSSPGYGQVSEVTGLSSAARTPGFVIHTLERKKNNNFTKLPMIGGGMARDCVQALGVEATTGGWGKSGVEVLRELAKIKHPGDDRDPSTVRLRAAWRTRTMRAHTFALLRFRFDVAVRKRYLIELGLFAKFGPSIAARMMTKAESWGFDHAQARASRGGGGGG